MDEMKMWHSVPGGTVNLDTRIVTVHGRATRLEPRAAAVLSFLLAKPGQVVSRSVLLDGCWGDQAGSDEALTQAIAQLRRALSDDPKRPQFIATVPKAGYIWLGSVERPNDGAWVRLLDRTLRQPGRKSALYAGIGFLGLTAGAVLFMLMERGGSPEPSYEIELVRLAHDS